MLYVINSFYEFILPYSTAVSIVGKQRFVGDAGAALVSAFWLLFHGTSLTAIFEYLGLVEFKQYDNQYEATCGSSIL